MNETKSEMTKRGMATARKHGRAPTGRKLKVQDAAIRKVMHLGTAEAARKVGLSKSRYIVRRRKIEEGESSDG